MGMMTRADLKRYELTDHERRQLNRAKVSVMEAWLRLDSLQASLDARGFFDDSMIGHVLQEKVRDMVRLVETSDLHRMADDPAKFVEQVAESKRVKNAHPRYFVVNGEVITEAERDRRIEALRTKQEGNAGAPGGEA